jgi:hypothetical protein
MPPPDAPTTPTPDAPAEEPTRKRWAGDLTVNKILAGAGAAATSAILGSYLGAAGTVAGAALGSLISTVATSIYQRSLDRTKTEVIARIRPVSGPSVGDDAGADAPTVVAEPVDEATVRMPSPRPAGDDQETQVLRPVPPKPRKRRRFAYAALTVMVFLLGMFAVTGFELVRGSTLWGGEGDTSVGRVIAPSSGGSDTTTEPTEAPTTEPDATPTSDPSATSTAEPSSSAGPGVGGEASTSAPSSSASTSAPATQGGGAPAQQVAPDVQAPASGG